MIYETVDLYSYFSIERKKGRAGYLTVYVRKAQGELAPKLRPATLIVPGGGYQVISAREGEPVAMRFLAEGYGAFVLEYSVNTAYPVPLIEAAMAMVYIRENAEKYSIDPAQIVATGFSAGGHLAGMLATLFADEHVKKALGDRAEPVRPDAVILSYAVITTRENTHGGTAQTISGGNAELRAALSLETRVTKDSAPAFIWHTKEDDAVPVSNSLMLAEAYLKCGVPFELHIFEKGWHGVSVATIETDSAARLSKIEHTSVWPDLAFTWLRQRGFCVRDI